MENIEAFVDKYFKMLYPNYDKLSDSDKWFSGYDREFLVSNFYEIDSKFLRQSLSQVPGQPKKSPNEILTMVLAGVRSDKNFETLHPDYEQMSDSDKWVAEDDREFLFNHDAEISKEYYRLRGEAKYVRGEEPNAHECMKQAVENVKAREEQTKTENQEPSINEDDGR